MDGDEYMLNIDELAELYYADRDPQFDTFDEDKLRDLEEKSFDISFEARKLIEEYKNKEIGKKEFIKEGFRLTSIWSDIECNDVDYQIPSTQEEDLDELYRLLMEVEND